MSLSQVWLRSGQQHTSSSAPWTEETLDFRGALVQAVRFTSVTASGFKGDTALADITLRTSSPLTPCLKNHSDELRAIAPAHARDYVVAELADLGLGTPAELYVKTDAALLLLCTSGVWAGLSSGKGVLTCFFYSDEGRVEVVGGGMRLTDDG